MMGEECAVELIAAAASAIKVHVADLSNELADAKSGGRCWSMKTVKKLWE